VGITKTLISFKADEANVDFIDMIKARLSNRVSRSAVCNELVTVCRIMHDTRELTLNVDGGQLLLSVPRIPNDKQASFNFD
jgi:hypothetical protein